MKNAWRVVGSVREVLFAPEQLREVIARIARAETQIVSLTVTEKGYCANVGQREPLSVIVDTYGTGKVPEAKLTQLVHKYFDLSPIGIINKLNLRRPIYKGTAAYGHFGRQAWTGRSGGRLGLTFTVAWRCRRPACCSR